jgi:hypothetical protein
MVRTDWPARHPAQVWIAAAALGPLIAALLTLPNPRLHDNHVTLVLVLAVALVAAAGRPPAGLLAALTTALAYDYFWTVPYYSLRIFRGDDILTVVLLVLVGGAIEQLSWWAGRQHAAAARRLTYLNALRSAAEPAVTGGPAGLDVVAETIRGLLDADLCRVVLDQSLPPTRLHSDGRVTRDGRGLDVDFQGLPTDDVIALVVPWSGSRPAFFAVTAASHVARPTREQRQVAALLAELAAGSLPAGGDDQVTSAPESSAPR